MRHTLVIAGNELRLLFTTWSSYVVIGAFFLLSSLSFIHSVASYQSTAMGFVERDDGQSLQQLNLTEFVLQRLLYSSALVLLFLLPILTMRLIAGERHDRTLVLLLTAPIRTLDIICGKFTAMVVFLALMLGLTVIFPVLLHVFGSGEAQFSAIDWPTTAVAYIGLLLLGMAFAAIGLSVSSFFNSQIAAAVVSYMLLAGSLAAGTAAYGAQGWRAEVLGYVSFLNHLGRFLNGLVRLPDVAFFVSVIGAGLLITAYSLEHQRES